MISLRSIVFRLLAERRADLGQVAQERNLRGGGRQVLANQAADDHRAAVGAHDVGGDLRDRLLRQREALLDIDGAGRKLRMDFQADQPVVADEGPNAQQRADVEEIDGLRGGAFGDGRADVAQLFADLDFGPLLVEAGQARRGDDVGVADRFQGVDEQRQALRRESRTCRPPSRRR